MVLFTVFHVNKLSSSLSVLLAFRYIDIHVLDDFRRIASNDDIIRYIFVTIAPEAMTTLLPTVTPGLMTALPPIQTLSQS